MPYTIARKKLQVLYPFSAYTSHILCFLFFLSSLARFLISLVLSHCALLTPHVFSHRTLLIDTLLKIQYEADDESEQPFSLTAYHLSNSGQGPKLDIYDLPLETTGFLREMKTADYRDEWNAIVSRAWEVAPKKKRRKKKNSRVGRDKK